MQSTYKNVRSTLRSPVDALEPPLGSVLHYLQGKADKHRAAPCLTRKAAPSIISEPNLPGSSRKGMYEGPTAPHAVSPFYFPPWM
jgi:hypothetical protein